MDPFGRPPYLYAGNTLWVDLCTRRTTVRPTAPYAARFLGGAAVAARIVWEQATPGIDALGPQNPLVFSTGPFTGTMVPASGHCTVGCMSPFNRRLGLARLQGFFGPELKYAGYDNLVIEGVASEPTSLCIRDNDVSISSAVGLWGLDPPQTARAVRTELNDPDVQVACIGPAGQDLLHCAAIFNGPLRTEGGTGVGAVMGSKNIKAIAIRGNGGINVANSVVFNNECSSLKKSFGNEFTRQTPWPSANIAWKASCFNCSAVCIGEYRSSDRAEGVLFCHSDLLAGLKIGIDDERLLFHFVKVARAGGFDIEALCETISSLFDLYERGVLRDSDIGFPLIRGDGDAFVRLLHLIAQRESSGPAPPGAPPLAKELHALSNTDLQAKQKALRPSGLVQQPKHQRVLDDRLIAKEPKALGDIGSMIVEKEDAHMHADQIGICARRATSRTNSINIGIHASILSSALGKQVTPQDLFVFLQRALALRQAYDCRAALNSEATSFCNDTHSQFDNCDGPPALASVTPVYTTEEEHWSPYNRGLLNPLTLESLGLHDVKEELARVGACR